MAIRRHTALALLLLPRLAVAHIVPVPPSTCAFDPITIDVPASGISASAAPASGADQLTIRYDPQASLAQFDAGSIPARAFTGNGVTGTLALPAVFSAHVLNSGDLLMTSVPLAVSTTGPSTSLPITLTTGPVAAGSTVVEGSPLDATGRFKVVGIADGSSLPAPLDDTTVIVNLTCVANPRPDVDQFEFGPQTTPLSVGLTAAALKMRALVALGAQQSPDFAHRAAVCRASAGGITLAVANLPQGLPPRGRIFIGRSEDGHTTIAVARVRGRAVPTYLVGVKIPHPTLPTVSGKVADVRVTCDLGSVVVRANARLRANRRGTRLRFP